VYLVLLFLLAVAWAMFALSWIRSRSDRRGVNSISSFSKHLSVLGRATPVGYNAPVYQGPGSTMPLTPVPYAPTRSSSMSLADARRRRRTVLMGLSGLTLFTLVLVPFGGTMMLLAFLFTAALLAGYVVLLLRTQKLAAERRAKVHYLPSSPPAVDAAFYLQHSVN
jgi:hypothetical protein